MKKKPCRFCQTVRGSVNRALGRRTLAEKTEEARDASTQRRPALQRARTTGGVSMMSIGTPRGQVLIRGRHEAVEYAAEVLRGAVTREP